MKQRAKILENKEQRFRYRINLGLQQGLTATFEYSDRTMAREHYDQLRFHGVVGGVAIRTHSFEEVAIGS